MSDVKHRHWGLTTWLVLLIILHSGNALISLLDPGDFRQSYPDAPAGISGILIILSFFNAVCALALFQWKKWGFWGFCVSAAVAFLVNLSIGLGISSLLRGVAGVAFLYGVLQLGNDNKGWPQLE
jgi:hypothetical protein